MKNNKKLRWIMVIVLILIIIVIGVAYAFWSLTDNQKKGNKIATACIKITYEEDADSAINLEDAYPLSDEDGLNQTPYTFKITNSCSKSVKYSVNLDILTDLEDPSSLELDYVKVDLNGNSSSILSSYDTTFTSVSNAFTSKKLYVGELSGNESKSFELRLWLDEDTPIEKGEDKYFSSKIIVTTAQSSDFIEDDSDEVEEETKTILASYITTLASTDTTNLAYDGTEDNNLRYIGADPSNYLCFDEDCSNGKWRVIGIMNNMQTESNGTQSLVKIIRADIVGQYAWNSSNTNDWTTSSLNVLLNSGDLYETYIKSYDNLFESVVWNLGGYSTANGVLTSSYYTYERGTTVYGSNPTTWTGKIALMYPSDYGYATSGGNTTNRETCLAKDLYNWDSSSVSDCKNNDYLYNSSWYQWILTPYSSNSVRVFHVNSTGYVDTFYVYDHNLVVRPVGYLKSDVVISGGEGTSDSPWIISKS
jgi:uncharacterized protein YcnI